MIFTFFYVAVPAIAPLFLWGQPSCVNFMKITKDFLNVELPGKIDGFSPSYFLQGYQVVYQFVQWTGSLSVRRGEKQRVVDRTGLQPVITGVLQSPCSQVPVSFTPVAFRTK